MVNVGVVTEGPARKFADYKIALGGQVVTDQVKIIKV